MAKALTEEEKIRRMKLRLYQRKKESLSEEATWNEEGRKIKCPVCGKEILEKDIDKVEYVKTKRHSEIFVHTKCVSKWGSW